MRIIRNRKFVVAIWLLTVLGVAALSWHFHTVAEEAERNQPLIEAIKRRDEKKVRALLAQGLDPNCRDVYDDRYSGVGLLDRLRRRHVPPPVALAVALADEQVMKPTFDGFRPEPYGIVETLLS